MPKPQFAARRFRRLAVGAAAFGAIAVDFHGDPSQYFTYFTVLTNLSIGTWFLASLVWPKKLEGASVLRLALTIYGLITLSVYWALLAPTHHPQGLVFWANLVLHLVVPAAMAVEDLLVPWPRTKAAVPLWILVFPLAYCAFAVIRGELTGWYPYFFLNKNEVGGWVFLGLFLAGLLAVFAALAYGWRLVVHRRRRKATAA